MVLDRRDVVDYPQGWSESGVCFKLAAPCVRNALDFIGMFSSTLPKTVISWIAENGIDKLVRTCDYIL